MSPGEATILVVEDEESYVEALTSALTREGFAVEVARDGIEALARFDATRPDLVLLDLMLPRLSGVEVCRQIRAKSSVPVIMVTAKSDEIDAVVGLEVGADDYVTKPYRIRELVARIRAALRRVTNAPPASEDVVTVGDLRLDAGKHEVQLGGVPVALPLREFQVLDLLMVNAGRVVTRENLIDQVWGGNYVGDTKTLDVHIRRLRAKLDQAGRPSRITTVRGVGYRLETSEGP